MLDPVDFPFKAVVMTLLPLAALAGLAIYAATLGPEQRLSRLGLAVIIGGAAGNLIDRVTAGYVLDFVDVYWGSWHFWAFNVADAAINIGVGLMILDLLGVHLAISAVAVLAAMVVALPIGIAPPPRPLVPSAIPIGSQNRDSTSINSIAAPPPAIGAAATCPDGSAHVVGLLATYA